MLADGTSVASTSVLVRIVLAMAVLVNSFPIGVGLAVLTLGPLTGAAGWPASLGASAALVLVALLLLGLRSQTGGRQATEVAIAADVLNRMLDLGRPE